MNLARLLLAVLSVAFLGEAAFGQGGGRGRGFGGSRGLEQPEYVRRDLPLFVDHLQMDGSQKVIVETLLLDYHSVFDARFEDVRLSLDALQPERSPEEQAEREARRQEFGDMRAEMREVRQAIEQLAEQGGNGRVSPEIMAKMEERLSSLQTEMETRRSEFFNSEEFQFRMDESERVNDAWAKERKQLGVTFMNNVKNILADPQLDLWPGFDMTLRRLKTTRLGRLSGEDVDLHLVLKRVGLDPGDVPELPATLDSYAYALDRALVSRNTHLEKNRNTTFQAMRSGDISQAEQASSREAELRVRVRNVNDEYAQAVTLLLGDGEEGRAFVQEYRLDAYPRVYRPTRMMRAFDGVRKLENLEEEILDTIAALEEAYGRELTVRNQQIVRVTREAEPRRSTDRIRRMAERFANRGDGERGGRRGRGGDREDDPIRVAYFGRDEMDYQYWQQLQAFLMPEQIALLPEVKKPEERGRRGGMEERVAEMDRNGDGKLQRSEIPDRMQGFFDRLDQNKDGVLDEKEIAEMGRGFGRGGRGGRGGDGGGGRGGDGGRGGRGGRGGA